MDLNQGTLLQGGKYRIIRTLGQGGFGVTYLAEHTILGAQVCIKEFFIKDYCNRESNGNVLSVVSDNSNVDVNRYKLKFLEEARKVSQINHPNIVGVSDLFEENSTAYFVMEYIDGVSLSDMIKSRGVLSEVDAVRYIKQVASALKYIHHRNILHLDIKPANIMVREEDESVVLIDFGLAKHYDATTGNQTTTLLAAYSPGYAPFEQCLAGGGVKMFCPATDIYALGATLYTLVTGECPPEAAIIPSAGLPELPSTLSHSTRKAITSSMEYSIKNRPQSVTEFISILGSEDLCNSGRVIQSTTEDTIIQRPYVEIVSTSENTFGVNRNTRNNATNLARTAVEKHFSEASKCGFIIGMGRGHKVRTDIKVDGKLIATIVSQPNSLGGVTLYAKSTEHTICLTKLMNRCKHFEISANKRKYFGNNQDLITSLLAEYLNDIDPSITSDRAEILNYVNNNNRQLLCVLASLPVAFVLFYACGGMLTLFNIIEDLQITVSVLVAIFPIVISFAMLKFYKYSTREFAKKNKFVDIMFIVISSITALYFLHDGAQITDIDSLLLNVNLCYFIIYAIYTIVKSALLYREFGNLKSFVPVYIVVACGVVFYSYFNDAYTGELYVAPIAMFLICSIVYACIKPLRIEKIEA